MPKKIPKKKSDSKFHKKSGVRKLPSAKPRELRKRGWMVCGFDTSMSSIAGAAVGYDRTLKKFRGPEFVMMRWSKEDEYFDRLREAAKSHELVQVLQSNLGLMLNLDEIFIAQEEPVPYGMFNKGVSAFMKQQCEISGAFLGGLVRYGYANIWQINSMQWRQMVAHDLGITTHHTKWKDPKLAAEYNAKPSDSGKFRSKQWALHPAFHDGQIFPNEIPDWPEIIETKDGKIPRPEESKAKAVQCDDRYDALAIMEWLEREIRSDLDKLTRG